MTLKCRLCHVVTSSPFSYSQKMCSKECFETYHRLASERGGYHVLERDLTIIELKKMCAELLVELQDLRTAGFVARSVLTNDPSSGINDPCTSAPTN